ncbi:MAG: 16S rRNA processing protein RimM [Bacilli bacterium]|nr:16S rRNA processing protein RimM [Bacilli bacterium]
MNKICIGKLVNTHGIKGEVRIISDLPNKDILFKIGNHLFIDNDDLVIKTYRVHKNYDMVSFNGIDDINAVLKYKNKPVYLNRDDLNISDNEYLITDLIGLDIIFNDDFCGKIEDYMYNSSNYLLVINNNSKKYYIPLNDYFVKKVSLAEKKVYVENIKDLI